MFQPVPTIRIRRQRSAGEAQQSHPTPAATFLAHPRSIVISVLALSLLAAGCGKGQDGEVAVAKSVTPLTPKMINSCIDGGSLEVETFGAVAAKIAWYADDMTCEGMPRPAEAGARLRFAGPIGDGSDRRILAFILSIPDLTPDAGGDELPTRVTIIEEDQGRFFSTREARVCWSNVHYAEKAAAGWRRVGGLLYCTAPIAELNGSASVSLSDLKFNGRVKWKPEA